MRELGHLAGLLAVLQYLVEREREMRELSHLAGLLAVLQ